MGNYVEQLLDTGKTIILNDTRNIYSDRMGPWSNQDLVLTWEGGYDHEYISITPDEVEVLFKNGRTTENVYRASDGNLYMRTVFADIRIYKGAIVCGIMAPSTSACMRQEILDYAKKMGYVTDEMIPVKMTCGTKSLLFNDDGTYGIFYEWSGDVTKKIDWEFLKRFTMKYFGEAENVKVEKNGVLIDKLQEKEVFSRRNIDTLRVYDIQLKYLDPEIDKRLLLRAAVQVAFIDMPCNTLRGVDFEKSSYIMIPNNVKTSLVFDEYGMAKMNCGNVHHISERGCEYYSYDITVPYRESVREVLCDVEVVLKNRYDKEVFVSFSKFGECFRIYVHKADFIQDVERALIGIDYALTLLKDVKDYNVPLFFDSIFSLLEADSSGVFKNEYFSYLEMMKELFPDKTSFM